MSSFIKDYFAKLRVSDEKTKHRSALFLSFVFTAIILSILFLIFKDNILSNNNQNIDSDQNVENQNAVAQNLEDSSNTKNSVVSPFTSFSKFIKDSGDQFSKIKGDISSTFSSSSPKN